MSREITSFSFMAFYVISKIWFIGVDLYRHNKVPLKMRHVTLITPTFTLSEQGAAERCFSPKHTGISGQ